MTSPNPSLYIVRCGHCGFHAEASMGCCPKCGYDGIEPRSEGLELVPAALVAEQDRELQKHSRMGITLGERLDRAERDLAVATTALVALKDAAEPFHRLDLDLGASPVRPSEWAEVCEPLREALVAAGGLVGLSKRGEAT